MNIYMIIKNYDFVNFPCFFCFLQLNNYPYLVKLTLGMYHQIKKLEQIITYRLIPNLD